jgi:hypothetical protein
MWTRSINLWFSQIKKCYIVQFNVEYTNSFSKGEINFEKGPRRKMMKEIILWIKMLFVEKGVMLMVPDRMDD